VVRLTPFRFGRPEAGETAKILRRASRSQLQKPRHFAIGDDPSVVIFIPGSYRVARCLLPESYGIVEPSFCTGTDAGTEAVTEVTVAMELYFCAQFTQRLDVRPRRPARCPY